jgi:hypothetical protein
MVQLSRSSCRCCQLRWTSQELADRDQSLQRLLSTQSRLATVHSRSALRSSALCSCNLCLLRGKRRPPVDPVLLTHDCPFHFVRFLNKPICYIHRVPGADGQRTPLHLRLISFFCRMSPRNLLTSSKTPEVSRWL